MMASMAASPALLPTALSPGPAAEQRDRLLLLPGFRPAVMSPSRWQQVIPAACRNVASPVSCATSASEVARSRLVSSRAARRRGE